MGNGEGQVITGRCVGRFGAPERDVKRARADTGEDLGFGVHRWGSGGMGQGSRLSR
jgi:hypothetical protein